MAFYDSEVFPEDISYGAQGGPGWQTDVVVVSSGAESRNATWSQARRGYDVAHAARLPTPARKVQAHFEVMQGRWHGFPFKDWADYSVDGVATNAGGAGLGVFVSLTSTTFQMYKRYTAPSSQVSNRLISKPKSGTIIVTGGTGVSVSYTTGIVTVSSGTPTSWTGQFYVPCRYDTDKLIGEVISRSGGQLVIGWQSIPIVEIRV
jgi:uncharacterized protein (TIGR02217 family)